MARLYGTEWWSDRIIDFALTYEFILFISTSYFTLNSLWLERLRHSGFNPGTLHVFSTHFYPQYLKRGLAGIKGVTAPPNLFNIDTIVIPIHIVNHWISIIICDPSQLLVDPSPTASR